MGKSDLLLRYIKVPAKIYRKTIMVERRSSVFIGGKATSFIKFFSINEINCVGKIVFTNW